MLSRAAAVRELEDGHHAVAELTRGLSDEELTRAMTIGDGDWSVKDLIGHLASWEEIAFRSVEEWRAGRKPWVEEEIFSTDEGVDRWNGGEVERKRAMSLVQVRQGAEASHARALEEIERMSDDEWGSRPPYETKRRKRLADLLGSVLGAPKRPFGHAFAHLPDLRRYVEELRREGASPEVRSGR